MGAGIDEHLGRESEVLGFGKWIDEKDDLCQFDTPSGAL